MPERRFGAILKQLRQRKGLTQKALANLIGHSTPESCGMMESGARQVGLEQIPQLATILGVKAKDLAVLALLDYFPRLACVLFPDSDACGRQLPRAETDCRTEELLPASMEVAKQWQGLGLRQRKLVEQTIDILREMSSPGIPEKRRRHRNDSIMDSTQGLTGTVS